MIVRAAAYGLSLVQIQDLITIANGGQAMSDNDQCLAATQLRHRPHHIRLGAIIERASGFIEKQYIRFTVEGTGYADPLPLPP